MPPPTLKQRANTVLFVTPDGGEGKGMQEKKEGVEEGMGEGNGEGK